MVLWGFFCAYNFEWVGIIKNVFVIEKCIGDKNGIVEIEISDYGADSSITKRKYTKDFYKKKKSGFNYIRYIFQR